MGVNPSEGGHMPAEEAPAEGRRPERELTEYRKPAPGRDREGDREQETEPAQGEPD